MICGHCEEEVGHVIPLMKQLYDENGVETGVNEVYYCFSCIQNLDAEDNVGVPLSK